MVEERKGSLEMLESNLKAQKAMYMDWLKEDSALLSIFLLNQYFRKPEPNLLKWQCTGFQEEGDYDFYCHIQDNWQDLTINLIKEGLELKNSIVAVPSSISLRALAVEINVKLRLSMHSSFYIMSRVVGSISSDTPVLKIIKDANLRGLFFVFGRIDSGSKRYRFIKQNQIPERAGNLDSFRELTIKVTDNGDDKIFVLVEGYGQEKTVGSVSLSCSGFVPEFRESQIFIAGAGDGVSVKSLTVQYKERTAKIPEEKHPAKCACIIC